jgi:hypothetical protein
VSPQPPAHPSYQQVKINQARELLAAELESLNEAGTPSALLAQLGRLDQLVDRARAIIVADLVLTDGWSYAKVGQALGISRQGARKVYQPAARRRSGGRPTCSAPAEHWLTSM